MAGFSRGAIASNFIGLNEALSSLWKGFICHSHYDGFIPWPHEGSGQAPAKLRLERLGDRAQLFSHEFSVDDVETYFQRADNDPQFTFCALPFKGHTDSWVLKDIPERRVLRNWFRKVLS